jgi:hypothetical protein
MDNGDPFFARTVHNVGNDEPTAAVADNICRKLPSRLHVNHQM